MLSVLLVGLCSCWTVNIGRGRANVGTELDRVGTSGTPILSRDFIAPPDGWAREETPLASDPPD